MFTSRLLRERFGRISRKPLATPNIANQSALKRTCSPDISNAPIVVRTSITSIPTTIPITTIFPVIYKRANNGPCKSTHHIRVDVLTELVRNHISSITRFANLFEDEFVKIAVDDHYKRIAMQQKRNQDALAQMLVRDKELDTLYERLYEEKILGNLSEERFQKLSYKRLFTQMLPRSQ